MSDPMFESRPEHMPLGKLVSWVGGAVRQYYQRTVARHGITGTAVSVLGVLVHTDVPLSGRELAAHVGISPATLTPVLDGLEQAGRITRERDANDRRIVRVRVTDAGREYLRSTFTDVAAVFREQMPRPSEEEQVIIRRYLIAVLAAIEDDSRCAGDPGAPDTEGAGG